MKMRRFVVIVVLIGYSFSMPSDISERRNYQKATSKNFEETISPTYSNLTALIERLVKEEVQRVFENFVGSDEFGSLINARNHSPNGNSKSDYVDSTDEGKSRKQIYDEPTDYDEDRRFRDHYAEPEKYSKYYQLNSPTERPYYSNPTKRPPLMRNSGFNSKYASSGQYDYKKYFDPEILAYLESLL